MDILKPLQYLLDDLFEHFRRRPADFVQWVVGKNFDAVQIALSNFLTTAEIESLKQPGAQMFNEALRVRHAHACTLPMEVALRYGHGVVNPQVPTAEGGAGRTVVCGYKLTNLLTSDVHKEEHLKPLRKLVTSCLRVMLSLGLF